jgi:hypothetical protein
MKRLGDGVHVGIIAEGVGQMRGGSERNSWLENGWQHGPLVGLFDFGYPATITAWR